LIARNLPFGLLRPRRPGIANFVEKLGALSGEC
jgi:hypothetical protein